MGARDHLGDDPFRMPRQDRFTYAGNETSTNRARLAGATRAHHRDQSVAAVKSAEEVGDQAFPQNPTGQYVLARSTATDPVWVAPSPLVDMASNTVTSIGGGQAHENMQPWLALYFCIALQGLFPSRN